MKKFIKLITVLSFLSSCDSNDQTKEWKSLRSNFLGEHPPTSGMSGSLAAYMKCSKSPLVPAHTPFFAQPVAFTGSAADYGIVVYLIGVGDVEKFSLSAANPDLNLTDQVGEKSSQIELESAPTLLTKYLIPLTKEQFLLLTKIHDIEISVHLKNGTNKSTLHSTVKDGSYKYVCE